MQRAQQRANPAQGGGFKKPDPRTFIPEDQKDAVDRVVAAGMKTMYAPTMREELRNEINRKVPVAQKLSEGVVGLVLTLDKQAKGGIPQGAIFPAILMLLGEAADLLVSAGQRVTQDDYNLAAQQAFVLYARKMGANDSQIMQQLRKSAGQAPDNEQTEPAPDAEVGPGEPAAENEPGEGPAHEQAEAPSMEQQETQATARGLPEPDEQGA